MDAPVTRCERLDHPDYRRSRGRLQKSWSEVIRHDLKTSRLVDDMAQDRRLWRSRIKVVHCRWRVIYLSFGHSRLRSYWCVRLTVFTA